MTRARAAGDRQTSAVTHASTQADGDSGMDSLAVEASRQPILSDARQVEQLAQERAETSEEDSFVLGHARQAPSAKGNVKSRSVEFW